MSIDMEALDDIIEYAAYTRHPRAKAACDTVESIRRAAKDLVRLHVGDGVYNVRGRSNVLAETRDGQSTWDHPEAKAWSDAASVLESIAKDAP